MRKLYIGTNTKMYKSIAQTRSFLQELGERTAGLDRRELELFVIPSFTALETAGRIAAGYAIRLGAQNMAWEDAGQLTGEISPVMLEEVGVTVAEIGHSERRHILGETDELLNRKVRAAHRHGMTALLCIGETEAQKEHGIANEVLRIQLKEGLHNVAPEAAPLIWIAYEPVWAIGTSGKPAGAAYAEEKHRVIHNTLRELFGTAAQDIPVLYGGSVNAGNAAELIGMPHVDGLFIGRSAWEAARFADIIRSVLPVFRQKGHEA